MSEDKVELGRRVVACKGWRWMPGMATVQGERVVLMDDDGTLGLAAPWGGTVGVTAVRSFFDSSGACLPDFSDPATLGCLLALVRESEGCAVITSPDYDEDETGCQGLNVTGWRAIETVRWMPVGEGATEAEALEDALEGAP